MNLENKPIGIIGAMDNEIELLKSSMDIRMMESIAGMTFYCGTLCGKEAVLVRCGMGKVNAAICAQLLITHFGAGRVINTGVAGSLNRDINIGDIVVSTDAVQHDINCQPLGYPKGYNPDNDFSFFQADEAMRRSAVESAKLAAPEKRVYEGRIASGDQFIADNARKQAIIDDFGAICCEMEGAAIGQVCVQNRVPFVIIRAISDKADDAGHLSYRSFVELAARHSAAIVRHMIENV